MSEIRGRFGWGGAHNYPLPNTQPGEIGVWEVLLDGEILGPDHPYGRIDFIDTELGLLRYLAVEDGEFKITRDGQGIERKMMRVEPSRLRLRRKTEEQLNERATSPSQDVLAGDEAPEQA